MKPSLLLLALGALAVSASAIAAPITADSRISAVAVYLDRAVITRTATVDLPAGDALELEFAKLPAALLDQSLQAAGQGTASATLLDVTPRPTFVDFTPNDRVKALEDELLALNRQDRTLADRLTVLGQQRDYVLKIQTATTTPTKDSPATAPSPETWITLLKFSEDQLAKLAADVQSVETQREDLQIKRTALEQQFNQLRGENGRSYKTVTVRLTATTAGQLTVNLRYTVPGAAWTPSYDARASSGEQTVQLGYAGLVRQNTGEDWTDADLTLSTARPSLGGAAPELQPWIVQQREIQPMVMAAAMPMIDEGSEAQKREMAMKSAIAMQERRKGISFATTTVETQATSATFRIPGKTSIPSDNAPHKVGIATLPLAAELSYQATPKLLPAAFLTAKVANTSDYPLLAGALNIFLDDTFVATGALRSVMPGEKFDLALGPDDAIAVKRKLNNRLTEDTGLVNKGHRITYDITLTAQNNKKTPAKLTLVDQLPISRHEKIVVKLLAPEGKDVKPDAEGLLKWNLTLVPGEKRELPLKFSIEYPNDLPVSGLE